MNIIDLPVCYQVDIAADLELQQVHTWITEVIGEEHEDIELLRRAPGDVALYRGFFPTMKAASRALYNFTH